MSPNVENIHKFNKYTHFFPVTKNDSSSQNSLFMVRFQLIWMSCYTKVKLQMCCITQHQCRCRQMWKMFTNSPRALTFVCCKKLLVLTEQSIHDNFQLISMSCYAKNKQQMCCVTQHQCRSRLMWKIFTNSPRALTFVCYKK